ncbi:hypothetical protein B0T21DRAFT_389271 [Apiosordaria backusii]|uniref:Uncharacterized protein n=1 Tax=Apiosordaria backusii TaxID=314023 RepID=A0AA40EZH2_9PEZI|nr:hypothetical protein B0T21DRAFT_389271 [Apiosordaria backusii]
MGESGVVKLEGSWGEEHSVGEDWYLKHEKHPRIREQPPPASTRSRGLLDDRSRAYTLPDAGLAKTPSKAEDRSDTRKPSCHARSLEELRQTKKAGLDGDEGARQASHDHGVSIPGGQKRVSDKPASVEDLPTRQFGSRTGAVGEGNQAGHEQLKGGRGEGQQRDFLLESTLNVDQEERLACDERWCGCTHHDDDDDDDGGGNQEEGFRAQVWHTLSTWIRSRDQVPLVKAEQTDNTDKADGVNEGDEDGEGDGGDESDCGRQWQASSPEQSPPGFQAEFARLC